MKLESDSDDISATGQVKSMGEQQAGNIEKLDTARVLSLDGQPTAQAANGALPSQPPPPSVPVQPDEDSSTRSPEGRWTRIVNYVRQPGFLCSLPVLTLLLVGFVAPLLVILLFSFMPPQTFSLWQMPTLENFRSIFSGSYYLSFIASIKLATLTVLILLVVCYPLAVAMVRVFGKHGSVLALIIAAPLFVADNLRLLGWMLFMVKGGIVSGSMQAWFGVEMGSILYSFAATLFGLVYIYLPFMLFPMILGISMVPGTLREAAFDLGATTGQVLREVDLPLAMPGILIGAMICFILTAGAITEAKVLGGTAVVMIAQDIQKEFTFAQNWPKGSALAVLMILLAGGLALSLFKKMDLDAIVGRR